MKFTARLTILAILSALFLIACGGSNSEIATAPPAVPPTGSLQVDISGLPQGTEASVQISGPNGFNDEISAVRTLSNLAPGTYTLIAKAINAEGLEFDVQPSQYSLSVTANNTVVQSLVYMTDTVSNGVISNFGSVYVNGVRFNTDDAIVKTDDRDDADEDSLGVGMTVRVQGRRTADSAITKAHEIEYQAKVKGVVESISLSNSQIKIFDHTFSIDDSTLFVNTTMETLVVGDIAEVSAIIANDGLWLATRVEKEDSVTEFRLRGFILNLNPETLRFSVGGTLIDYASASIEGVLVEGAAVSVSTDQAIVDGVLIATAIKIKATKNIQNNDEAAIDGVIQTLLGNTFNVNDTLVSWDETTEFKGGNNTSLAIGARVKVKGTLVDEILVAHKVRFEMQGLIEVEGAIQAIDLENNLITLLDLTFLVDEFSQLKDESSENRRRVRLDLLALGDWIEIKAFSDGEQLIVKKLERQETNNERDKDVSFAKIKGSITEVEAPNLTVQGYVIATSDLTIFEAGEFEVDAAAFFEQLSVGDWVEIKGVRQLNGIISATKVETSSANGSNNDDASEGIEFSGIIENFISITEFSVNGRTITTNEFSQFTDGNEAMLANGVALEIHGREAQDGSILATRVHFEDADEDKSEAELEGTLALNASENQFVLNNVNVIFNEATVFEKGDAQDLVLGASVEVKGLLNQNGDIIATRIQFENEDNDSNELEGEVTQIINESEFMIGDVTVLLNEETEFEYGNLSRLLEGVWVKVEGFYNDQDVLIAAEIKFTKTARIRLEGIIEQVLSESQFSVNGITIQHDQYTEFDNGTVNDLTSGIKVEIKGFTNDDAIFVAFEIEFDD